jgi:NADH-quinone oxidoreductase subunit H
MMEAQLLQFLQAQLGSQWSLVEPVWPLLWSLMRIVAILAPVVLAVAYLPYFERKVIAYMHVRIGPNRVGPAGLLQPIADALKLVFKEIIVPSKASKVLYILGPIMALAPALIAWAVIPFDAGLVMADIDAGVLYLLAVSSLGVYGIIISGWASNSKYAFMGAMRATAQMVSYEVSMGMALIVVLMISNSLNLSTIVAGQGRGIFAEMGFGILSWNWLPLLPMFFVFLISGVAETNRSPFDVVEGESEIVAGHMVEYSGMAFALFFLAEYANMILVSAAVSILFLGGWLSPVGFLPDGIGWLIAKISVLLFLFLWFRATFPRYRYDQIMRLGWKVFLPLCFVWIIVVAIWMLTPFNIWQ